jgi:hypothetical protein
MACDTFIKIAQKCRRHFVMQQSQEQEPFVDEILRLLHRITVDLSPQQVRSILPFCGNIYKFSCLAGAHILRGSRVYDLSATEQTPAGETDSQTNGTAKQRCAFSILNVY